MKKFDSIPRIGRSENLFRGGYLTIQEKMDGANFRFALADDLDVDSSFDSGLIYGSKNVEFHDRENCNGSFEHAVDHVESNINIDALRDYQSNTGNTLTIYGEAMHKHTMEYSDDIPSVLIFDVWSSSTGEFFTPSLVESFIEHIGLDTVPILEFYVDAQSFSIDDYTFEKSRWLDPDSDGPKTEGIVIKNSSTRARAKYRTDAFTEAHWSTKQGDPSDKDTDNSKELAIKYTTEARVMKHVYALRDNGHEVEMEMMPILWKRVFQDIIEEEYETIFTGDWEINTADFRNYSASKTASVLENYLQQPQ